VTIGELVFWVPAVSVSGVFILREIMMSLQDTILLRIAEKSLISWVKVNKG